MRIVRLFVAGLFVMVIGSTVWAAACDGFTDVDNGNTTYCSAVTYLKDKGITLGCTGTTYCPNDYVTRLQMALFLQRMGKGDTSNTLDDASSVIGGGTENHAGQYADFVGGGTANSATGLYAFIGGGYGNSAPGFESAIPGGYENTADGEFSIVLGGLTNSTSRNWTIAAGRNANANQEACAVFALWGGDTKMDCGGSANVFRIGASHGFSIDYGSQQPNGYGDKYVGIGDLSSGKTIATWTGAFLSDAGVWTSVSDRAVKEGFTPIDQLAILDRVVHMPVERWRYKVEPTATHIGPVAQDFYAAFNVGTDDKHITSIDEGGVALAAIQGLNAKLEALVAQQARDLAHESHELAEIKAQLASMTAPH